MEECCNKNRSDSTESNRESIDLRIGINYDRMKFDEIYNIRMYLFILFTIDDALVHSFPSKL